MYLIKCQAIQDRNSCRCFDNKKGVPFEIINQLIFAASLAPSGKNLQPWKFKVINESEFGDFLFGLLPNNRWTKGHSQFICAFLNSELSYYIIKDSMSIAAAIQNILIEATANDVDTCWIGECTEYTEEINSFIKVDAQYKLLAIIAIGYNRRRLGNVPRKVLSVIIL